MFIVLEHKADDLVVAKTVEDEDELLIMIRKIAKNRSIDITSERGLTELYEFVDIYYSSGNKFSPWDFVPIVNDIVYRDTSDNK